MSVTKKKLHTTLKKHGLEQEYIQYIGSVNSIREFARVTTVLYLINKAVEDNEVLPAIFCFLHEKEKIK